MKGMGARLGLSSNRASKPVEQVGGAVSVAPKLKPLRFKL